MTWLRLTFQIPLISDLFCCLLRFETSLWLLFHMIRYESCFMVSKLDFGFLKLSLIPTFPGVDVFLILKSTNAALEWCVSCVGLTETPFRRRIAS
jgi:hypothetical protein